MALLAPYMLWGALAATIPVALHFFFRSRYRRVPWAAMSFLLTSIEQTSRRRKFQELLLLLARITLLALLAFALARPSSPSGRGAGAGDAVHAVLVIDNSLSMDARDGPATRLEHAKASAVALIDHLPPHSTVAVLTCSDRVEILGPRNPSDLDQARQLVEGVRLSHRATDLLPGVAEAAQALRRGQALNKELHLFSDMQKRGWEQQGEALSEKLREVNGEASVYLVRCGTHTPINVCIAGVVPQLGVPHAGERAGFAVLVRNTGSESARNLTVTLAADGKDQEAVALAELRPGETKAVPLTARWEQPGLRVLSASVTPDDLAADNRFEQVVRVREQVRVLVVDGAPDPRQPEKAASFFLNHALIPVKDADKPKYHIQPRLVTPRRAAPSLLADVDLCVLVNVAVQPEEGGGEYLGRDFLEGLGRFVREGHGLIVFGGDRVTAEPYNRILGKQQGLLPLPLAADWPTRDAEVRLNRDSAAASFVLFREGEAYQGLDEVRVQRALTLEGTAPADGSAGPTAATVLLRYADGRPAVVTRAVGTGEVLFVTTSADLSGTDWPLQLGMYVPFVDATLNHLLNGQTRLHNRTAGEPIRWSPPDADAARSWAVRDPDGRLTRLGPPIVTPTGALVAVDDTSRAGVYRLVPADAASGSGADAPEGVPFAVVPGPDETEDLTSLPDAEIDARLGFTPVHRTAGEGEEVTAGSDRLNREWAIWALAAVLLVGLVETGLAWLCGRPW